MNHFTKLATGLTGLAAIAAVSSPATAQINPYGQVSPYGYPSNGVGVGAGVNAAMDYGQYPQGNYGYEQTAQRSGVEMCARSAEQRLNSDQRYNGYGNDYGQQGDLIVMARTAIAMAQCSAWSVSPMSSTASNGALRVSGIASSDVGQGNARLESAPGR